MTLESHRDVIAIWPSLKALSDETGIHYETVAKWNQRERIPSEYWELVVSTKSARKARLVLRDLARIDAKRLGMVA